MTVALCGGVATDEVRDGPVTVDALDAAGGYVVVAATTVAFLVDAFTAIAGANVADRAANL